MLATHRLALLFLCACSAATPPVASRIAPDADVAPVPLAVATAEWVRDPAGRFVLTNARAPGGAPIELHVDGGSFAPIDAADDETPRVDAGGAFVVPAVIDAHVHFAYLPMQAAHAAGGVAGAVDLASPTSFLAGEPGPIRLRRSGPMITAPGGYPTRSWGAGGYGLACDGPRACADAVRALAARGVDLVKVPLGHAPALDDASLGAVVEAAHALDLAVAAHALDDAAARRAALAGVDILAHTPTAALSEETVEALSGVTVISTLAAFGGGPVAVDNLARLRRAGATIVYGTDFGNSRTTGIDRRELLLLLSAGLDEDAVLDALTRTPAEVFAFDELGALAPGHAASFILVSEDPRVDVLGLADPAAVCLDGRWR